jgi:hypothetical protein
MSSLFTLLCITFAFLDPDPQSRFGSQAHLNPDPDPDLKRFFDKRKRELECTAFHQVDSNCAMSITSLFYYRAIPFM